MDSELQLPARYGRNGCVMVLGGNNWLFAGSLRAGQRAASINPYRYLKDILERLPAQHASRIEELLPHRWPCQVSSPDLG